MISVKLMGGLGNQMFQYATAYALAKRRSTQLILDVSGYAAMDPNDTPRNYELDVFSISSQVATTEQLSRIVPTESSPTLMDRMRRRLGETEKLWVLSEPSAQFFPYILKAPNNTHLVGWWQNEKYFKQFRSDILREFTPVKPLTDYSLGIIDRIHGSAASASIHVRRGDYVANKNANVYHGLTPIEYYKKSVDRMLATSPDMLFVVFSDDIAWCKENLPLPENSIFVEPQPGRHDYEDIMIMKVCSHAVIANSSFSWWGAWLNENDDKIVIAPAVWFQDEKANAETDIVPADWVRL